MAMAGQGLHAAPPPRPASHNYFGGQGANPGNQLYVGNVWIFMSRVRICALTMFTSFRTKPDGRTSRTFSALRETLSELISTLGPMVAPRALVQLSLRPQKMQRKPSVRIYTIYDHALG